MNKVKVDSREYSEYYIRRKQKTEALDGFNIDNWEEVPDEDLWQDGEIKYPEIKDVIYHQVVKQGVWKLIREIK